ncbi:MAG: M48 family metalloprotease [Promethearchaeota archaeon]
MRLAALRTRMIWALFVVFLVAVLFCLVMSYIIDIVLGYFLFDENFFALMNWWTIPFLEITIPYPIFWYWAFIAAFIMVLFQWAIGPAAVRAAVKLNYVDAKSGGRFYRDVQELAGKADIPMPKVAVVNSPVPNAFVFGRTAGGATLAVHKGLLDNLSNREIRGVLGHEIGHIRHRDIIVMTLASSIPLIALMVLRGSLYGARGASYSGRSSSDSDGAGALIIALIAIAVVAAIAFGLSLLAVRGLSRMREHYADAYSGELTGDPRALSSALARITWGLSLAEKAPSSGLRSFYIGDPKQAASEVRYIRDHSREFDLDQDGVLDERELVAAMESEAKREKLAGIKASLSTHPPTYKRILLLYDLAEELGQRRRAKVTRDEAQPGLDEV